MRRNDINRLMHIINESVRDALNEGVMARELANAVRSKIHDLWTYDKVTIQYGPSPEEKFQVFLRGNDSVLVDMGGKSVVVNCQDVENENLLTRSIMHGFSMLTLNLA